ncbi:hypothetical protein YC2023_073222 [Brassica napus]
MLSTSFNNVKLFKTGLTINVKVFQTSKHYTTQTGEMLKIIFSDRNAFCRFPRNPSSNPHHTRFPQCVATGAFTFSLRGMSPNGQSPTQYKHRRL